MLLKLQNCHKNCEIKTKKNFKKYLLKILSNENKYLNKKFENCKNNDELICNQLVGKSNVENLDKDSEWKILKVLIFVKIVFEIFLRE